MLPTSKTIPKSVFSSLNILIYADPGVGKTTFCAQIGDEALFLATEAGHNALSIWRQEIKNWDELKTTLTALVTTKHNWKTLVIDTVDNLYPMCEAYICKQEGVKAVADIAFGGGFTLVRKEFMSVMNKLTHEYKYSIFFITHAKEKEVTSKTTKYSTKTTSLPDKPATMLCGMCDFILYAYVDDTGKRMVRTKPTKYINAKDRYATRALELGNNPIPEVLPLDYKLFVQEFEKAIKPGNKEEVKS